MGIFKLGSKSKKKESVGKSSINKLSSPYLGKTIIPKRKRKRVKRKTSSILPPARLNNFNKSKIKKLSIIFSFVAIIIFCSYLLFFSPFFAVKAYQIIDEGTVVTDRLDLNTLLDQNIVGKNILFLPELHLKEKIVNLYPEIKDIAIQRSLPDKVNLELKKYPTIANVLNVVEGADGISVQKKYLINSNGIVTNENEENPELPYIKIYTPQILDLKSEALSPAKLDYVIKLVNLFEEKFGIAVVETEFLKREREIHLKTEKLFYVWIDMEKDLNGQLEKLKKALPKLDIYKTPLEYIDLRISGTDAEKVIYKRRKS